ncbi:MAG TPA: DNA cytosine methyltransferase [Lacunisphaera sp.]|jgi:DNA (cytosine-5)-methyltransferase 1|nr:DNA cytosine methyltransferase [Lacunisphaera sp.]
MIAPHTPLGPPPPVGKRAKKTLLQWILQQRESLAARCPAATLRLADLFAGCGGLTLGAVEAIRRAGFDADVRFAIDLEPECVETYAANFRTTADRLVCGSIADLLPGEPGEKLDPIEAALQAKVGNLDIVLAGPPCQGHSDLNNHSRRDDPKNRLYLKAVRFVEVTRPKVALIENVPAARHDKSKVVQTAAEFLRKTGYQVRFDTISAHRFGLPQRRRRLVMLAVRGKDPEPIFARYRKASGYHSVREIIGDLQDEPDLAKGIFGTPSRMTRTNVSRVNFLFREKRYDLPNHKRPNCHRDNDHSYKSMYGRLRWDRLAQTITGGFGSMGQGRYVHPSRKRVITPHEAARLQGFPDYFDFGLVSKRTALHQMIGNAVPPVMAFQPIFDLINDGYIETGA